VIDAKQVGHAAHCAVRVSSQSLIAVEEKLRRIVGRVTNEWLWIDNEPRFPLRSKDVACVQIGSKQHLYWCGPR
jgi:hypothetical protein